MSALLKEYSVLFVGGPAFGVRGVIEELAKAGCSHSVGAFSSHRAASRYLFGTAAQPVVFERTSAPMLIVLWPGDGSRDVFELLARVRMDLVLKRVVAMILTAGAKPLDGVDTELLGPALFATAPRTAKDREALAVRVSNLLPSDDLAAMRRLFRDIRPTPRYRI